MFWMIKVSFLPSPFGVNMLGMMVFTVKAITEVVSKQPLLLVNAKWYRPAVVKPVMVVAGLVLSVIRARAGVLPIWLHVPVPLPAMVAAVFMGTVCIGPAIGGDV